MPGSGTILEARITSYQFKKNAEDTKLVYKIVSYKLSSNFSSSK